MRCNRKAPARHAVAGIPSGEARDAARSATSERMAKGGIKRTAKEKKRDSP